MPSVKMTGTPGSGSAGPAVPAGTAVTEERIYAAIADVLDPELDEPLVKLGFIDRVLIAAHEVEGADVTVTFKLPTF